LSNSLFYIILVSDLAKGDRHEIIKEDSYNFSGSDCAILFTCVNHSLDIEEKLADDF